MGRRLTFPPAPLITTQETGGAAVAAVPELEAAGAGSLDLAVASAAQDEMRSSKRWTMGMLSELRTFGLHGTRQALGESRKRATRVRGGPAWPAAVQSHAHLLSSSVATPWLMLHLTCVQSAWGGGASRVVPCAAMHARPSQLPLLPS